MSHPVIGEMFPSASRRSGRFWSASGRSWKTTVAFPGSSGIRQERFFERIQQKGYPGGYTQVKEAVRELKQTSQEVFVPLIHRPGEAQVDFGYALVNVDGQLRKLPFFVMTLPYSDAMFVQVFERISTEIYSRGAPPSVRVFRWCARSDHV